MSEIGQLTIPLFVGTVMNWALLGALAVQVYIYYLAFPDDRRSSKAIVAFLVVAETLQTFGDSRDTIRVFGAGWGNPEVLNEVGWAWFSVPILGSLVASVGQIFFAWRIYIIAKSLYVPVLISIVAVFQLGAGIWTGIDINSAGEFTLLRNLKPPVAWLSATAASDLIIVAAMVFYLRKATQPEFRSKTKVTLSRIIRITVETGVLCALSAIADLALFIAFDGNNYHLGVCIWLSKVYSNSIMIILNSRAHIGHNVTPRIGTNQMSQITEVVFQRSQYGAPTSAMQFSINSTAADSNVVVIEGDSDKNHLETVV